MRSNTLISKALIALALLSLSALSQGEGTARFLSKRLPLNVRLMTSMPLGPCASNEAEWVRWRDEKIQALLTLTDGYLDNEVVMARSQEIADAIDTCKEAGLVPPASVMGNLELFTATQRNANYTDNSRDKTHQFGHAPNDRDYLSRAKQALELPCLLRSAEFLDKLRQPNTYRLALEMIETQNGRKMVAGCPADGQTWETLIYRSRFLSTPDDAETFGRFFVLVPGADYDRWIQFGIWPPEDCKGKHCQAISNVSIVAVAKQIDPTRSNGFDALTDWWRVPNAETKQLELKARVEMPPYESDNCTRCHKTIPLGIHPAKVYTFKNNELKAIKEPEKFPAVKALNARILNDYSRAPAYETGLDDKIASPLNYGPPFGRDEEVSGPPRTPESVRACTARHGLGIDSVKRVIENMNCASCHNGRPNGYGMLSYGLGSEKRVKPDDDGTDHNVIRTLIVKGVMPLRQEDGTPVNLNISERKALYDCLSREYLDPETNTGLFVDWLRMQPDVPVPMAMTTRPERAQVLRHFATSARTISTPPPDYAKCVGCHTETAQAKAPSLRGVFMRQFGSTTFKKYSKAMKEAGEMGLVWDEPNLMDFLKDTDAFMTSKLGHAAQSDMFKRYADEAFRRSVVQYLMTFK